MKNAVAIRAFTYSAVVIGLLFLWRHHRTSKTIPIDFAGSTNSFFSVDVQTPAELTPEVLDRARETAEIIFHTSLPQTGIEPLRLRLMRDGTVFRNTAKLSDYKLYPTGVLHEPILRTEEASVGRTEDFDKIAYLLAALKHRSLPFDPNFSPIFGESIDVLRKNGEATTFYFLEQPPEFWSIVQSLYQLETRVSWEVLETKTLPTQRPERNAGVPSRSTSKPPPGVVRP